MFVSEERLLKIENELKKLQFQVNNPPKYKEGDTLEDGTLIVSVEKIFMPESLLFGGYNWNKQVGTSFAGYTFSYKGVKDGKIIYVK